MRSIFFPIVICFLWNVLFCLVMFFFWNNLNLTTFHILDWLMASTFELLVLSEVVPLYCTHMTMLSLLLALDKPKVYMIVPCGHKCLCEECAEALERRPGPRDKRACPLCRVPVQRMFKVFEWEASGGMHKGTRAKLWLGHKPHQGYCIRFCTMCIEYPASLHRTNSIWSIVTWLGTSPAQSKRALSACDISCILVRVCKYLQRKKWRNP